jgi:hypothetical protein
MNSFEQLRQEVNTRETIQGYRKDHPPVTDARLDGVKKEFGAKHPGEIEMWRTVWDDFNVDYNRGIPESYLPNAIRAALGLSKDKATDAVKIAKEFDLLLEADPADTVDLQYDTESGTILRLVLPTERPDLYCEDVERFVDRNKWAEIWGTRGFDRSYAFGTANLINILTNKFTIDTEAKAKAAIEVGTMSRSIIQSEDGYILSGERPQKYWLDTWSALNVEYDSTISISLIQTIVGWRERLNPEIAEEKIEKAVERGELYNPEYAENNDLAINDPSSEKGPEIERKVYIGTDESNTVNDNFGSSQQITSDHSPTNAARSGNEDAETGASKNGNSTGIDTDTPNGQPATTNSNTDSSSNTSEESGSDYKNPHDGNSSNHETESKPEHNNQQVRWQPFHGFLSSIGPENSLISQGKPSLTPSDMDSVPDDYETHSDHILFDLHFQDVTSLKEGFRGECPFCPYDDSGHFHVLSEKVGYCRKFDVCYTPETAVLVAEGERLYTDPSGSFSPKDKFVFWRHVRQKGILECPIPKDALVYYAISNDIADKDDVIKHDSDHGEFETLPDSIKCDTLAAIGEEFSLDIKWKNYDSVITKPDTNNESGAATSDNKPGDGESDSAASTECKAGQSAASGEQSAAGQSGESDGSESATSHTDESSSSDDTSQTTGGKIGGDTTSDGVATGDDQPTDDDDDEMLPEAGDVEGGAKSSDIFDDVDEIGSDSDSNAAGDSAESDGATKFHTYEEPDLSNPSIDVDIDAVAQFIEHHATTEDADGKIMKTRPDTMIAAFDEWAEMNDVPLDDLDSSVYDAHRKGDLNDALKATHEIQKSRRRLDGDNVNVYHPVALNDNILSLIK